MVEAAIILPVLMVFLLGIIEFGLVYATGATATGASRSGARLAAASFGPGKGDLPTAADNVASAVSADLQALTSAVPIGMVVYQVDASRSDGGPAGGFPSATDSMSGGCTAKCYRYMWSTATKQMANRSGSWTFGNEICQAANTPSVGVWVLVRHSYLTQLIGKYNYVKGMTVMRLEPLPTAQCTP